MTSLKTYIINDNGEYKIKEQKVKDKILLKNTLDDRRTKMKMSKMARTAKENNTVMIPEVVNVSVMKKIEPVIPIPSQHLISIPKIQQIPQQQPCYEPVQEMPKDINLLTKPKEEKVIHEKKVEHKGLSREEDELQKKLLLEICKIIGIQGHPHGKVVSFDVLNDPSVIKKLFGLQDLLKEVFPSSKLTALHSNAVEKQQFPGVNIVRQIFKEMGFRLKSINISDGYLGTKKLLRREYQILKL